MKNVYPAVIGARSWGFVTKDAEVGLTGSRDEEGSPSPRSDPAAERKKALALRS